MTVEGLLTQASGCRASSDRPYWTTPDLPFPTRDQIDRKPGERETRYPAEHSFQYSCLGRSLTIRSTGTIGPYYVREHLS